MPRGRPCFSLSEKHKKLIAAYAFKHDGMTKSAVVRAAIAKLTKKEETELLKMWEGMTPEQRKNPTI
jgi:hypothetical protein